MFITEIVRFKTTEDMNRDELIKIVDGLEKNFHSKQKGFVDTELLYHEAENEWYMIQHWQSKDELKEASRKIFTDQAAEDFVKALDKQSVKMLILPQINTWAKTI